MRLYMPVSTEEARRVIDYGFTGTVTQLFDRETKTPTTQMRFCEFRDIPPTGLTPSRTAEVNVEQPEAGELQITISGGAMLDDYGGDFIVAIDVPEAVALREEVHEDPPSGWPFRRFWLPEALANEYRETLKVFDSQDGEEVRPDLVGR